MKFIKLEILNLASLDRQGGETINFEEGALGSSTIFSIVGPTGSGKSTILDAICLALYNRTPRYIKDGKKNASKIGIYGEAEEGEANRLAPSDPRNILTRGKKDGYSKLTFQANNGSVYRAEWTVHKKVKDFDNAHTSLYRLVQKDGVLTEEQADWNLLPQIIGLDYEQFLRTVLIAQGSFANFLTASEEERYVLLEKLIGCEDMYVRIAQQIKDRKKETEDAYNQIVAHFSAFKENIIPEEELSAVKSRIAELEEIEKKTKEELLKVTEAIAWYVNNEKYLENIGNYTDQFNKAKAKLEALREESERLTLHDATLPAVALYKDVKTAEMSIQTLTTSLEKISAEIQRYEQELKQEEEENLAKLVQEAEKASNELDLQKPHINKAREIKAELESLKKVLKEKTVAHVEAEKAKKAADDDLSNNERSIVKASADQQRAVEEKVRLLADIETEKGKKAKALEEIEAKITEENAKIAGIDIERLNGDVVRILRIHTLMTSEQWAGHRADLKEGQPCPLCGGTHHPYADKDVATQVENEMSTLLKEKQRQQKEYNDTKMLLDQLNTKKDGAIKAISIYAEEAQKKAEEAEKKVSEATTLLQTEKGKTVNLQSQQTEKATALTKALEALQKAKSEVDTKIEALKQEIGDKDPDAYEKLLQDAKTGADKAVTEKREAIGKKRELLKEVKGKESATREQLGQVSSTCKDKQKELAQWLSDHNAKNAVHITEDTVAQLYASTDNWESIRHQQTTLKEEYTSAETTLKNETTAHQEHQQTKPAEQREDLMRRKEELDGMSRSELVDIKARLQRHEDSQAKMGSMAEQIQEAQLLMTEWHEIAEAIGSDGKTLRKIAQCYTLRFLIEHANVEIRKFNTRYELQQVKNSLGIRVIDHDRADDVRDTTSLSGGETFIVSLGLALGLSALSSRNINFENLFIDEGFGTLDPDTLATVIDSLAMLQSSQGKKVGVISHTDTMSERITTQIRIIKNGNSGSSHIEIFP